MAKKIFVHGDKCCYCNREFTENLFPTKEHIIPRSDGGTHGIKNLQSSCFECNQLKANLNMRQFETVVWNVFKILNGKYSLKADDLEAIYRNLKGKRIIAENKIKSLTPNN